MDNQPSGKTTLESMSDAKWYNEWLLKCFDKQIKGEILEIGCGIGNFTALLMKYGNVYAFDISADYMKVIEQQVPGVRVGVGNIEKGEYFFKDKKFDSIVCFNVLEHVKNDKRAVSNIYQLLNKNGKLFLIVPAHKFLYGEIDKNIEHYRRYEKSEISDLLVSTGFKIIKTRKLNFLGGLGWFIAGRILKDSIVKKNRIKIFNLMAPMVLFLERMIEAPIGTSILVIAQRQ